METLHNARNRDDARGPRARSRAVVVDRAPLYALGLSTALQAGSIDVVGQFVSMRAAAAAFEDQAVDLLVLGWPADMNTESALAELRSRPRAGAPLPVVVLVFHSRREQLVRLLHLDATAVVGRTIDANRLVAVVEAALAGNRHLDEALLAAVGGSLATGQPSSPAGRSRRPAKGLLTAREAEVLDALAAGKSIAALARSLGISRPTAKSHLGHIYRKLEVGNRREALARAFELRLLNST